MRDVLVIGAGPAGCIAASYLANQGYEVTILEREKFPRFVIGESLLPVSMEHFEETGLLSAIEQAKFETKPGALFMRGQDEIDISFAEYFTPGWTWTWQVPRDEFDQVLADETEKKGVRILYETTIEDLVFEEKEVKVVYSTNSTRKKESFRFVIDSSGNAGVVAKTLGLKIERELTGRRSIFTQVKDIRAFDFERPRRISFDVLAQDLWFWVIPFSNGNTSLGFVGDKKWFDGPEDQNELLRHMIRKSDRFKDRFEGLDFLFDVRGTADYTCKAERLFGHRYVLTGNTTGFIDPVFSSGVALATSSSLCAAKQVERILSGQNVDWQKDYSDYVAQAGGVFGDFVNAWYDGHLQEVFFTSNIKMDIKKQITSVLAGYVWDKSNPFVKKGYRLVKALAQVISLEKNVS